MKLPTQINFVLLRIIYDFKQLNNIWMSALLHDCYFLSDTIFCATHWIYALSPKCCLALLVPFSQLSDSIPWITAFHSLDGLRAERQDGSEPRECTHHLSV